MGNPIPLWLLRDLKCRHCGNFLSCGPVYVTPDCGLLCGRCKALAKPNFRNYLYEELANIFRFPCENWENHCPEEGPWNTLKEHEINYLLYLEVPEKCLNLVCCKNCGKYLSCQPVHINVAGSNICHRCYLSNGIPPHTLRNLAYEKIANIFRFPCIFRAKGCPMKFKFGRDSWEHEVLCHYKDVQIASTPPVSNVKDQRISDVDNSGYRLSYEGGSAILRRNSFHNERPAFELPRVASILNDQAIAEEIRRSQLKMREEQSSRHSGNRKLPARNSRQDESPTPEAKESIDYNQERDKTPDKEKGIVSTHSGHVYATLTRTSVLFAPPQMQPNTDPSNGLKVTRELQDKLKRNASNASQGENYREKMKNAGAKDVMTPLRDPEGNNDSGSDVAYSADDSSYHSLDFPALNKTPFRNLDRSSSEFSPVVKEYVQYNPQNNVQRNESITIGNADLIAELKMRNEQRRKNRQQNESSIGIEVH
ncbi:hypothetical protein WA026_010867 [Henosepilachna vigintioctopunctata]|uniref:C2H2-type domain-containing protein n=1 Tax=Henosepilachna vigintioctopunctata TaxID=420089 RepID=A0AAW1US73_9CUCU